MRASKQDHDFDQVYKERKELSATVPQFEALEWGLVLGADGCGYRNFHVLADKSVKRAFSHRSSCPELLVMFHFDRRSEGRSSFYNGRITFAFTSDGLDLEERISMILFDYIRIALLTDCAVLKAQRPTLHSPTG